MKIELGKCTFVRGGAQILFILFFVLTAQIAVYANGTQDGHSGTQPAEETRKFLHSFPSERPAWVDTVPQSNTEFYFVGTSHYFDNAANARNDARENARNQVLKFYGEFIERQAIESGSISGLTGDTLEAFIVNEDEIRSYAENVIDQVATDRYYTEVYLNKKNQEEYLVFTLNQINRRKAEEDIANFAKNISQRYSAMITPKATLKSTLESYITVARGLQRNTLHRVTAYYESASGRVGLYGHVLSGINELINSIDIAAIPNRRIQKPDTLDTVVNFNSSKMPNIGPFDCRVSIHGMNINAPSVNYSITNDNSFLIQNHTARLNPGMYTVQIELLLQEVTGNLGKNINGGFTFEVTPLAAVLGTRAEIETGIKRAVDTLAGGIRRQTETRIGLFALTGTDIPSGLSRFLTERVKHYAINNPEKKYKINNEIDNNLTVVLSGFFTRRGDLVDITLELTTPSGDGNGSQFFSISVKTLNELGITVEPENLASLSKDAIIEPQENQSINIQAIFHSDSRTYFHRDKLEMTIFTDNDCHFKVIHIDGNNQMKMIYPNTSNKNNYLRANSHRKIFENASYMLYGPYGTEKIIVVASKNQFENIEQEYTAPWVAATAEAVRGAVRGSKGGAFESAANTSEAIYSISILKPHEEYEYGKPENMREMIDSISNDAKRQGGTFEGNETSGVYIVNNIRGSYRISRETPDIIQFVSYNLDNFSDGRRAGTRTRGGGFSFSIARPGNIAQAIHSVKAGIEDSGGKFTGNEQQGDFNAKGIIGRYRVGDVVNVTITEKPFMIPNSVIEREVRNYFGGR